MFTSPAWRSLFVVPRTRVQNFGERNCGTVVYLSESEPEDMSMAILCVKIQTVDSRILFEHLQDVEPSWPVSKNWCATILGASSNASPRPAFPFSTQKLTFLTSPFS